MCCILLIYILPVHYYTYVVSQFPFLYILFPSICIFEKLVLNNSSPELLLLFAAVHSLISFKSYLNIFSENILFVKPFNTEL